MQTNVEQAQIMSMSRNNPAGKQRTHLPMHHVKALVCVTKDDKILYNAHRERHQLCIVKCNGFNTIPCSQLVQHQLRQRRDNSNKRAHRRGVKVMHLSARGGLFYFILKKGRLHKTIDDVGGWITLCPAATSSRPSSV